MAYCGLKIRTIYFFIPLTCNFSELSAGKKKKNKLEDQNYNVKAQCLYFYHS